MNKTYLLWHCQRQGWVSRSGTNTDIKEAAVFSHEVALERTKLSKDHTGTYTVVPVNQADLA